MEQKVSNEHKGLLITIALIIAFISCGLALFWDFIFYLPPAVLSVWAVASLIPMVLLLWRQSPTHRIAIPAVYLLALFGRYLIPWNSRKAFLHDFHQIRPGMTRVQVEEIMVGYIRGTGWPHPNGHPGDLKLKDSVVFRHSNEGSYDSDWGVVRFAEDRVVETSFLPD